MHIVPDRLLSKNKYLPSGETLAAISLAPEFTESSSEQVALMAAEESGDYE